MVATLDQEQMMDLLKTSVLVTVTVIPKADKNKRRGCTSQNCNYGGNGSLDGEYDNIHGDATYDYGRKMDSTKRYSNGEGRVSTPRQTAAQQRVASANSRRMRYERSISPPRSSSSSGYGTGSSSRSFTAGGQSIPAAASSTPPIFKDRFPANPEGTLTSTSSGHSSDDPWYDLMPDVSEADPPPLPLRQGPERMRGPRPHLGPTHSADSSPNKKAAVAATPTYSTPPKPKSLLESSSSSSSPVLVGRMSNYEDIRTLDRIGAPGPLEAASGKLDSSTVKGRPANPPDYHHAMQSRLVALKSSSVDAPMPSMHNKSPSFASRSEDELSAGSTNSLSPQSRRRHNNNKNTSVDTLTPTSSNSRNQSPRLLVEAKLKSTGSVCSGGSGGGSNKNSQRCSSNLQEDLLRLISPDEDVVTRAHPVPVSGLSSDGSASQEATPSTADEEMDWSRLVDAAARAIQGAATSMVSVPAEEQQQPPPPKLPPSSSNPAAHPPRIPAITIDADQQDSLTSWIDDVSEKLRIQADENAPGTASRIVVDEEVHMRMDQLEQHVGSLENRLRSEEDRRQSLEAEILRLRDANSRLQGESQTAAQQLKRFTDWFFQTIERP